MSPVLKFIVSLRRRDKTGFDLLDALFSSFTILKKVRGLHSSRGHVFEPRWSLPIFNLGCRGRGEGGLKQKKEKNVAVRRDV